MLFSVVAPMGNEASAKPDPKERVMDNALAKARSVLGNVEEGLIVGADTVVYIDEKILGKPSSEEEAHRMMETLSGRVHRVFTGLAVIDAESGREEVGCEETQVHLMKLSDEEISRYVELGESMGKAGAYAIQGLGAVFVERVVGCFHNVVGLPLSLLWKMVISMGYDPFSLIE
ncbi:septum formation protein Maf, partial [Candidatus Bathyarchaeota archaeon]|nr:septum formation protein Maf [Candidatus Bathyarchaeota archaeon]